MASSRRLSGVLGKFKKDELREMAEEMGVEGSSKMKPKGELLAALVVAHSEALPSQLLKLELSCFCKRLHKTVTWQVYRLDYANPMSLPPAVTLPDVFMKKLQQCLGDVYDNEIFQEQKSMNCWLCIRLQDQCSAPYTCYIVRRPPSPIIFVTGVRKRHLATLLEAICQATDSTGYTDMDLSGKNLESIMELACNQHSQGAKSCYRLNQVDCNPLLVASRLPLLKRPQCPAQDQENQEDTESKRLKIAEETFGTNPLPKIEKFSFKLCAELPDQSDTVTCKIRLTGRNVLEGTKAAIAADCFTLPVPSIISNMPSYASNSITFEAT